MPAARLMSLFHRLLILPARHPLPTLAVFVLVVALGAWSASRIRPVPSLEPMFAGEDAASQAMLRVLHDFSAADTLLLLVSVPEGRGTGLPGAELPGARRELLAFAGRLEAALAADAEARAMTTTVVYRPGRLVQPFVQEVIAPAGVYYLRDEEFEGLRRRLEPGEIRAQIARNEALLTAASPTADALGGQILQDPLRLHEFLLRSMARGATGLDDAADPEAPLIGASGRSLLIRIGGAEPAGELDFTRAFMAAMRRVVAAAEPGGLEIGYTGGYPIAEFSERVIRSDMTTGTFGSIVVLQIIFLIAYRNPWSFPLTLIPLAGGIVAGFGLFGLWSSALTPVIAASGAMLAGLGDDFSIHYLSHYGSLRGEGRNPRLAAEETSRAIGLPVSAACVTSLFGFLAIGASRVPALRDFGWLGAMALGCVCLGSLTVLPAVLQLLDRGDGKTVARTSLRFSFEPLMRWIGRHGGLCITICLLALASAGGVLAARGFIGFEPDMKALHPRPSPPMETSERLGREFPGAMEAVQVHLQAGSPEELVRLAQEVDERLSATPLVREGHARLLSIASLLPDPGAVAARRAAVAEIDAERVIRDFRAAVEASLFDPAAYEAYEGFLRRMLEDPAPPDLATLVQHPALTELLLPRDAFKPGASPPTQAITLVDFQREFEGTAERQEMHTLIRAALADLPDANPTGLEFISADVERTIRHDVRWLGTVAVIGVFLWLGLVFRRVSSVLLALLPPLFCLVCLFAVMRVMGERLNVVNLIALPLLVGLGVDAGIFLMSLAEEHRDSRDPEGLVKALSASCHAVTLMTLTTIVGFGALMFTQTPAISSLGLVLTVGMTASWVASLFLLAPIVMTLHRRRLEPRGASV